MKAYLNILLLLISILGLKAQKSYLLESSDKKPNWINRKKFSKSNEYFRVKEKPGTSPEAAYNAALDDAVRLIALSEGCIFSSEKIKVTTRIERDGKLKTNLTDTTTGKQICPDISTQSFQIKYGPYYEHQEINGKITYYCSILVYYSKPKLVSSQTAMLYSLFPGGGQMYKKEYGRTVLIWTGFAASAVGAFHLSNRAVHWRNVADGFPSNKTRRDVYERYQRANTIGAIGCGVAAAGLYIWNLYDARHHENPRIRTASSTKLKLQPYYVANHGGVMLTYSIHPKY